MPLPHILLAILINVGWGGNFVAIRYGLQDMSPIFFSALRFAILLPFLLPWLKWRSGRMKPVLLAAALGGPMHFSTVFLGTALLGHASSAAFLTQLAVPITMLLAFLFLGERIGKWRIIGMAVSFVGVAVLSFDPHIFGHLDGVAVLLWSQCAYACCAIFMRKVQGFSMLEMQAWMAALSAPGLMALSFLFESGQGAELQGLTATGMGALAYSILGASILGHGGAYFLYQRHPVTAVMPYLLLSPVFATIGGVWLLGEELTLRMIIGGLIISTGVAIVVYRERRRLAAELGTVQLRETEAA
ncbi:DMT family transporter [Govanella unica]|uniref:DMT family transporter n=1 Tax=Govanella unica TaxID=2975056 RepID=A0A9X3TZX5_9PROT|nr:DMT family transporter [Govania unica]MDA5195066.1 DMT family transporter [Govania unica]